MCCTRLAEYTGCKKSLSGHHPDPTTLSGYIFATKASINNRKKLVKQQYLLHMSPQRGELWPANGWDLLAWLGHPGNGFAFWLRYCTNVAQRRSTKLCRMFGRLLGWYIIHFWRLLPPNGILPGAKFTLCPCVLLYWQRYCMALEQRQSAKLSGVV